MKKTIILPLCVLMLVVGSSFVFAQTDNTAAVTTTATATSDAGDLTTGLSQVREQMKQFKAAQGEELQLMRDALKEKRTTIKAEIEKRRTAAKTKLLEHRKNVLLKLIDLRIKHLKKTGERVAKMPNVDEALKADLAAKIDTAVKALEAKKTEVEAATDNEKLKELAKSAKDLSESRQSIIKDIIEAIKNSRGLKSVEKAADRATSISEKIAELKTAGKDVTALEAMMVTAQGYVASAKTAQEQKNYEDVVKFLKLAYDEFKKIAQAAEAL